MASSRWLPVVGCLAMSMLVGCASGTGGTALRAGGSAPVATQPSNASTPATTGAESVRPFPTMTSSVGSAQSAGSDASVGSSESTGEARWVVTVVRHAERRDDGTDDPPLTDAGKERAARLADRLAPVPGAGVYATPYQRTQATAAPTATAWGVPVTIYDPSTSPQTLLEQVARDHPSGHILIVGHSDTVPGIVAALCTCPVDPIADSDFGNLYQVSLSADGSVIDYQAVDQY
jgi:broad specificity phosphatase PhoE